VPLKKALSEKFKGTGLYSLNARYYDASLGRFITEDPARNGMNWFVYCGNNPLRFVDPTGLWEAIGAQNAMGDSADDRRQYRAYRDEERYSNEGYRHQEQNQQQYQNTANSINMKEMYWKSQLHQVGLLYIYGGNDPALGGGLDCSGSALFSLREIGYSNIPDMTCDYLVRSYTIPGLGEVGDILVLLDKSGQYYVHMQTLGPNGRVNATGGEENDRRNPGIIEYLPGTPPNTGEIRQWNWELLEIWQ